MIKLALIGKDIQHSKSPQIYKKLIGQKFSFQYDLLDFKEPSLIPSISELAKSFDGINITSPYKKHFFNSVRLTEGAKEVGAINCLRAEGLGFCGENTDFLAIMDILNNLKKIHGDLNVIILGDGVMSQVAQVALRKKGIAFVTYSRKLSNCFDQLNTVKIFKNQFKTKAQKIVINTCSREFIFNGTIDRDIIFWDFNYDFLPHASQLPSKSKEYIDGMEMLELQAVHALAFWSINPLN